MAKSIITSGQFIEINGFKICLFCKKAFKKNEIIQHRCIKEPSAHVRRITTQIRPITQTALAAYLPRLRPRHK